MKCLLKEPNSLRNWAIKRVLFDKCTRKNDEFVYLPAELQKNTAICITLYFESFALTRFLVFYWPWITSVLFVANFLIKGTQALSLRNCTPKRNSTVLYYWIIINEWLFHKAVTNELRGLGWWRKWTYSHLGNHTLWCFVLRETRYARNCAFKRQPNLWLTPWNFAAMANFSLSKKINQVLIFFDFFRLVTGLQRLNNKSMSWSVFMPVICHGKQRDFNISGCFMIVNFSG